MIVNLQRATPEKQTVRFESVVMDIGGCAAIHYVCLIMDFGCSDHGDMYIFISYMYLS